MIDLPAVPLRTLPRPGSRASLMLEGETVRFADLEKEIRALASFLLRGKRSLDGERIAMLVEPGPRFVVALLGIARAGACAIVLSSLHPPLESAYFCDDGDVGIVLTTREMLPKLGLAAGSREIVFVEELPTLTFGPLPSVPDEAAALQLYTSGTTGKPKGAVLSHRNLAVQAALLGDAWQITEHDVLLHALPLHHMHGLVIALLSCLASDASVHFLPKFDAVALWEAMRDATLFMGVPTMYGRLLLAYDAADARSRELWERSARGLRLATSGSAALPVTIAEKWEALAGAIPLERFGMTEIGVGMSNPLVGDRKKGSVGFPLPTVETRVTDDAGEEAESGELWIRGPSVFSGYFGKEEATRAAFREDPSGGLPWFRTGDTVERDPTGRFRMIGRTSTDILKSGGYKLSALEIEEVLRTHPAILDVAVVGISDEAWGDRVVAAVTARDGRSAECTTAQIRLWARELLATYKLPKNVVVFDELPRNAMGKVVKPELLRILAALPELP